MIWPRIRRTGCKLILDNIILIGIWADLVRNKFFQFSKLKEKNTKRWFRSRHEQRFTNLSPQSASFRMEIEIEKFLPLHACESKHDKTLDFANDIKLSLVGLSR